MDIGELAHFDKEGWAILVDIIRDDIGTTYQFYTLKFYGNEPRAFFVPVPSFQHVKTSEKCDVRYSEIDDIETLRRGNNIFYFRNAARRKGAMRLCRIEFGTITSINLITRNIVLDNTVTIKMDHVIFYEHNFEQIENTESEVCTYCRALHTPLKSAKMSSKMNKI